MDMQKSKTIFRSNLFIESMLLTFISGITYLVLSRNSVTSTMIGI